MKLSVRKHDIDVAEPQRLVSGSINLVRCHFTFDKTWDGYGKTAVFATFGGVWAVPLVADEAVIPWEALEAGRRLRIGVYGIKDDIRLPTVYTEPLFVEAGAEEGKEPAEPTQSKWSQLMAAIENGLLKGDDGYTPLKGKDGGKSSQVQHLQAKNSSGERKSKHFLGRELIRSTTRCTSSSVTAKKSVPLGKKNLIKSFVFSLSPLCHGECESAK